MLEQNYADKKIQLVETGYYHCYYPDDATHKISTFPNWPATNAGQLQFTKDLIAMLNKHESVNGLYWWFPEANEYWLDWETKRVTDKWYNASLFDNETGKAQDALYELKTFVGDAAGISDLTVDRQRDHQVYDLQGRSVNRPTKGLYIVGGRKVVVK